MKSLRINHLQSGGLITNYNCTSKCRHCLYNCSSSRSKDYIDPKIAKKCFNKAKSFGADALHIGGGEPMLALEKLELVLEAAEESGITIDYVETNSSWFKDEKSACEILESLHDKGLNTLLISISPFHVEYIPFFKVVGVMKACEMVGISIFPWIESFIHDLMKFDTKRPIKFEKLVEKFGDSYLSKIKQKYWIHSGGRAINTFRSTYIKKSAEQIIDEVPSSCARELSDTSHFHMDLYQIYIPGLCAGLSIELKDIGQPVTGSSGINGINGDQYPIINCLVNDGIKGLYKFAKEKINYYPIRKAYSHKCDLCNEIRMSLYQQGLGNSELKPDGYYKEN